MFDDLDPRSPDPLYLQLAQRIKRLIAVGALRPGERVPAVRELASKARVNRNTAARVIQLLETQGLIWTRVGHGSFVSDDACARACGSELAALDDAIDGLIEFARRRGFDAAYLRTQLENRLVHHATRSPQHEESPR
jgi:GntR family transcriptional regulator